MTKPNIGIVTFSISKSGLIPLSNFIDIFEPLSNDLYLISVNDGYTAFKSDNRLYSYGFVHNRGCCWFTRFVNYLYSQLKISYIILKLKKKMEIIVFTIGGDCLFLPILFAKIMGKKVLLSFSGSSAETLKAADDSYFRILRIISKITFYLPNVIVLYSPNNIHEFKLKSHTSKISIVSKHFLDFNKFYCKKKIVERNTIVGYVGRFSEEKGILNLIKSFRTVLNEIDVKFLLIGDGHLHDYIENYIQVNELTSIVEITGWIRHDELPDYLNKLKLLVVPSYTEGLPNIILEAMACGTPVLANSVGSIPDIIENNKTGFLMEENSPETIAKNIITSLNDPSLDLIVESQIKYVTQNFTFKRAVDKYGKVIEDLMDT